MGTAAKPTRANRTITVDFQNETTSFQLLSDGKAFLELVLAFILSIGFQLKHTATCHGGGCLTPHWHLDYTEDASAAAFTQSYGEFQRAASQQEPSYRVKGVLIDGFDSTHKSMRTLLPGARLGNCLRHTINKLPGKLTAIAAPVRKALRSQCHTLWYRARQRKGLRVFALGQRLRHFADHVAQT